MVGGFALERAYFYCTRCSLGFYPLDEALKLHPSAKQHNVPVMAAWLGSVMPFETAAEAVRRATGIALSPSAVHEGTQEVASAASPLV
ncbi:MAG: hypothetical protein WHS86_00020 [Desulfosoma sp.]